MPTTFRIVTEAAVPIEVLFDASLSIDLHVASMAHSGESAIDGVTAGRIGLGETVTWRARHFGIRWRMTSEISELEHPIRFVDRQLRGPFRLFIHVHEFSSFRSADAVDPNDAPHTTMTRMVDTITIASPVFGVLAERLVLRPYLRRLIRRRNEHVVREVTATQS